MLISNFRTMKDPSVPFSLTVAEAKFDSHLQRSFRYLVSNRITRSSLEGLQSFLTAPGTLSRPSLIIRCQIVRGAYTIRTVVDRKLSRYRINQCFVPFLERVLARTGVSADFFALISDRLYVAEDQQSRFREYIRCAPLLRCDYSELDPSSLDSIMVPDSFLQDRVYGDQLDAIEDAVRTNPFATRKEIIKWRGNLSGFVHPTIENFRMFTRYQLVMMSRQFPDMLEADLSNYDYGEDEASRTALRSLLEMELGVPPDWHPPEELVQYKYLISLDGSASSWKRVALILATGSVLLLQHRWQQFFYPGLTPWVHYVPIAHDLSNIREQYQWLQNNPHDAQAIAMRGSQFAQHILSPNALEEYFLKVINRCGKLQSPS